MVQAKSKRSFTVVYVRHKSKIKKGKHDVGGRFISSTPAGAARKAISRVCRSIPIKGQCSMMITIKETTAGCKQKEFKYNVRRVKNPVTVVRGGEKITYKYKTIVKAAK